MRIRLYVYSRTAAGDRYDTGVFDSSAPPGEGCLNPDAQAFGSMLALTDYARPRGESLQQTTVEGMNAICGYGLVSQGVAGSGGGSADCSCGSPCGCAAAAGSSSSTSAAAAASASPGDNTMDWEAFIQSLSTGTSQIITAARTQPNQYTPYAVQTTGGGLSSVSSGNPMGLLILAVIAILILKS